MCVIAFELANVIYLRVIGSIKRRMCIRFHFLLYYGSCYIKDIESSADSAFLSPLTREVFPKPILPFGSVLLGFSLHGSRELQPPFCAGSMSSHVTLPIWVSFDGSCFLSFSSHRGRIQLSLMNVFACDARRAEQVASFRSLMFITFLMVCISYRSNGTSTMDFKE